MQIIGDPIGTVEVKVLTSQAHVFATSFPGFSPTHPMERARERERDPEKRWSRGSRTKLTLREESFVSHFLCLVYLQRSHSDRNSKIDLPTLLQL